MKGTKWIGQMKVGSRITSAVEKVSHKELNEKVAKEQISEAF